MSQMIAERTLAHPPSSRRLPLRRQRNFVLLWTGQTVSLTGSAVTTVALPLVAISVLGASAFEVGLLTAATYGAFLIVALPAGVVVDRFPKRQIMIWCDGMRLVVLGSVPVAGALGWLSLGQLFAVAFAAGACAVFFDVSRQSYLSFLLDPADLTEGFGKLGASASFAQVSGIRPSIWIAYAGSWAAGFLVYFSPLRRVRDVADLPAGEARRSPDR
jgi:hypothetical protein